MTPRSRRIRSVLIPLNLIIAAAMLIGLIMGSPHVTLIALPMTIVTAASVAAVLIER